MQKKPVLMIRGTECGKPDREEEFNDWYNNVHAPMLFNTSHIKRAARYERVGDDETYPKYLAVYEFESEEALNEYRKDPSREAILQDAAAKTEAGELVVLWRVDYKQIASWGK